MSAATRVRLALAALVLVLGCRHAGAGRHDLASPAPADGADGVELVGMLAPAAAIEGVLVREVARAGHVFHARAGATIEVAVEADTRLAVRIHGPRTPSGAYPAARDDDARATIEASGFYLVELARAGDAAATSVAYRLRLHCDGDCVAPGPVAEVGPEIRWVARAAEYRAATILAFDTATRRLEALHRDGALPQRWAIVSDVDETLLDNSQYQRERAELGTGFSAASWTRWVARREAKAVPGAVAFLRRVRELGGHIAIVTNRSTAECADTAANLGAVGLVHDRLLCRDGDADKHPRFAVVEAGDAEHPAFEVLLWVGDNIRDFPGLGQELRDAGEEAFAGFRRELVIVPNPMYGSWGE